MDDKVGVVLEALARSGKADNTLVIYLRYQGYLLGQHGRFEKHASFEEAVRVPFVMRLPGRIAKDTRSTAMVELVDLVPTVCDLCYVAAAPGVQGRSLRSVALEGASAHRDHVIVEY